MKKIILTISITLLFLVGLGSTRILHASSDTIDGEYTLVYGDDDWTVNGWYTTQTYYETNGYTPLYMNEVNSVEVDLSHAWYFLNNQYESMSFQEAFLYIEVASVNTSSDGYFMYDNQYLGNLDSDTLIYSFDVFSQPTDISFDIWWSQQGSTGLYSDTGSLRLLSMKLVATYVDTTTSTDVIDVDSVYENLPDTNEEFIRISSFTLYDDVSRSYHFTFPFYDEINVKWISYQFDVSIPEEINLDEFIKDNDAINIAYIVLDNGNRVLCFQPDLSLEPIPTGEGTTDSPQLAVPGFITMNLSTMQYARINYLAVNGIMNQEATNTAVLYAIFNINMDDLLSITFSYQYRPVYLLGIVKGDWNTVSKEYTNSDLGDTFYADTYRLLYGVLWGVATEPLDPIQEITWTELPERVISTYSEDLGGSLASLETNSIYKITCGTNDFLGATGYEFQDIVIMNIMYVYNGVVYSATTDLFDQDNASAVGDINWLDSFTWLTENYMMVIVILVGITALVLFGKAVKAVGDIIETVFKGIKTFVKLLGYFLKMIFKGIYYVLYFIFIMVPKGIYKTFYFLITPGEKRRQQARKERSFYVGRSI